MPPEVLLGHTESTPKIDIWSLGILLHAIVLGKVPFAHDNREELKKQIIEKPVTLDNENTKFLSLQCKDLLLQMLNKDPLKRIALSEIYEHPWLKAYKEMKTKHKRQGFFGGLNEEISSCSSESEDLLEIINTEEKVILT